MASAPKKFEWRDLFKTTKTDKNKPDLPSNEVFLMRFMGGNVQIQSFCQMADVKKKHYWIYYPDEDVSRRQAAENLHAFAQNCNAVMYSDIKKPKNIQFFLLNDYDPEHYVSVDDLLTLTGHFKGVRFGVKPAIPLRKDLQIVVCSRFSPYEIFARTTRRSSLNAPFFENIEDRFFIYRISTYHKNDWFCAERDRCRFLPTKFWTTKFFFEEVRRMFADFHQQRYAQRRDAVVDLIRRIMHIKTLVCQRHSDDEDFFYREVCYFQAFLASTGYDNLITNLSFADVCQELFRNTNGNGQQQGRRITDFILRGQIDKAVEVLLEKSYSRCNQDQDQDQHQTQTVENKKLTTEKLKIEEKPDNLVTFEDNKSDNIVKFEIKL